VAILKLRSAIAISCPLCQQWSLVIGLAKRAMLEDDGFSGFLQELLDGDVLEDAAAGITKKVIADGGGTDSLSEKQKYVFKTHVMDEYVTSECSRCSSDIPWSEMYAAHDNGGMCSWCWHMTNKDD
jgi:hypothetical protein